MTANSNYLDFVYPIDTQFAELVHEDEAFDESMQRRMLVVLVSVMLIMPLTFIALLSLRDAGPRSAAAALAPAGGVQVAGSTVAQAPQQAAGQGGLPAAANAGTGTLSPIFAREVLHWAPEIQRWAAEYDLDPNLVAIIMQVESCGDPGAASGAGAQGLFQVMPFHFTAGENMTDPDTNARRGLNYFVEGLSYHDGDIGRTFAGYNGGHGTSAKNWSLWPNETQRYYTWTTGIYDDIQAGLNPSPTLEAWLAAGGSGLCRQAASRLGLSS